MTKHACDYVDHNFMFMNEFMNHNCLLEGFLDFSLSLHCTKNHLKAMKKSFLPAAAQKKLFISPENCSDSHYEYHRRCLLFYSFHLTCSMEKSTMLDEVANGYEF